ncbi:hypothetical protein [Hydrogenophaga sp.]|uniref:hypothetical protein n=1 Tax=Hydrogenophaga sp. TaxID=1904254 RepID=UPI003F72851D
MNSADFDLQHTDIPQPKEVDEELATRDWPMPPVKAWAPKPEPTVLQRIAEVFR